MVGSSRPTRSRASGQPHRLPSLTGMRFIAAAMVFALHAVVQNIFAAPEVYDGWFKMVFLGGGAGVSFFFILSGFVLTWSVRSADTVPAFWRRRFVKIYPNHLLTFIAAVLVIVFVTGQTVDTGPALLNLFLLQAWSPDFEVIASVNSVAWSLSCEALFYLAFPLLYLLIGKIRPERLWAWAGGVVAAVFAIPVLATALPAQAPFPVVGLTQWETWFIYQFPPVRMLDFVFGIILARIVLTGRSLPVGFRGAALLTVVVYALSPLIPPTFSVVAAMTVPLGLLIAAGAVADVRGQRTGLSGRTWVWLGEVSFAFYMWHRLVIVTGHDAFGAGSTWSTPAAIAICLLLFAVTLVLAWLTFVLWERPLMRRFSVGRRRRLSAVGSPTPRAAHDGRVLVESD